ncbi:MAG: hypothetical protein AAGI52_08000 [Bacteroidota bacterium]
MTARDTRVAWIGASVLVAGALAIWLYPAEFEVGVFPGRSFETEGGAAEPWVPEIPAGVFGIAGLVGVLGLGLAWYLPWLGRRLVGRAARFALGAACVALTAVGLGGIPAVMAGMQSGAVGAQNVATFLVLLGGGLLIGATAGILGLVAVVRRSS